MAKVELVEVNDAYVEACAQALATQITRTIERWICATGVMIDKNHLMANLRRIAAGDIGKWGLPQGRNHLKTSLQQLAQRVVEISRKYLFLYEDMFADIEVETEEIPVVIAEESQGKVKCIPIGKTREIFVLIDDRVDRESYAPRLGRKESVVRKLVSQMNGKRGVVFTRFIQVSDALDESLRLVGVPTWVVDGRLKERERIGALREFQESAGGILVLTRSTGRRGLDIPCADYAILYSPKEEEYTVWQEVSRIRGRVGNEKPVYILGYGPTSESRRLYALGEAMIAARENYSVTYSTFDESKMSSPLLMAW